MRDEIKPEEILDILKNKISGFEPKTKEAEIGRVIQAGDGIAQAWGLDSIMAGELVEIEADNSKIINGMVMNLEEETVGIILFSDYELVKEGCLVRRTNKVAQVPVGEALLGRVVNPLGQPIDGHGAIASCEHRRVETKGPGIIERQNVGEPLQTGIKAIDAMIPIGRGQRELIIGDRRTGKTTIAIDTIINQKKTQEQDPIYCFYVAIGQKRSSAVQLVETLKKQGVMSYTTVVAATASEPAALQYLAPYAATAMAEYFRDNGKHALVIFDDLTKHSQAYRELSLLMRRSPGREAYPGDVFYLHSRLLERAAKMSKEQGGGSLTALPIVETQDGDVSAYIPTNVISITDGQIFLESDLFNSGLRPAINVGISVSRVGGDAQIKAMKQTASSLRIELAQFRELAAFMQFSSDLDQATKKQLDRGERLTEILKQHQYAPIDVFKQIIILFAGISGRLDKYPTSKLLVYEKELFEFLDRESQGFMNKFKATKSITDEIKGELTIILDSFEESFHPDTLQEGADSGFSAKMALAYSQRSSHIHKDMFKLVEKITVHELKSPGFEKEVEEIISGNDMYERDRLDILIAESTIIDYEESDQMTDLFKKASQIMEKGQSDLTAESIYKNLIKREESSSTALSPFFAIPHFVEEGKDKFQLVIVRSRKGIYFTEQAQKVHAIFFLSGTLDQRHFHLVVLSSLAKIVQQPTFVDDWLKAKDTNGLKRILGSIKKQVS
ncbi:MAG: F0F1 ATP synthase subunit alpha [Spirochaetales bacterium]|nr:F0F1 ATP synthase subunit alpha [Spirochaetales bacterium]